MHATNLNENRIFAYQQFHVHNMCILFCGVVLNERENVAVGQILKIPHLTHKHPINNSRAYPKYPRGRNKTTHFKSILYSILELEDENRKHLQSSCMLHCIFKMNAYKEEI